MPADPIVPAMALDHVVEVVRAQPLNRRRPADDGGVRVTADPAALAANPHPGGLGAEFLAQ
jgi:hypothetical protein